MWCDPRRLACREIGCAPGAAFRAAVASCRRRSLALCGAAQFERAAPRGVSLLCLELDTAEQRLLLAGAADGSVSFFDTGAPGLDGASAPPGPPRSIAPVLRLPRGAAHAHGVAAAAWYPSGGGLAFTAGLDGAIKGWDLGAGGAEALRFDTGAKAYALGLPPAAGAPHGLLAAGAGDGRVLLCDPAAGGAAHALTGHRAAVLSAAWLPGAEYLLLTGGADGAVRLWDVRTTGTLLLLDQHRSAAPERSNGSWSDAAAAAAAGGGALAGTATAHTGAVTCVCASPDGRVVYTHGGDGRVRGWCAARGVNLLLHFPAAATPNAARLGTRLALSADGRALYAPARAGAQPLCARSGAALGPPLTGGHFGAVVACVAHPHSGALFTAAHDGAVLTWTPRARQATDADGDKGARGALPAGARNDADAWSDDDEVGRGPRMG